MKERPILFSSAMVRAILEGRKTQTRRVIKPQPVSQGMKSFGEAWKWNEGKDGWFSGATAAQISNPNYGLIKSLPCPYGVRGDRLWVRETFQPLLADGLRRRDADYKTGIGYAPNYVATSPVVEFMDAWHDDEITPHCTPSIFMPRWASRITLEITDVRVQRVQEISEEDAQDEGFGPRSARALFRGTWGVLNDRRGFGWDKNPWVWCLSFRRLA